jgi:hypothetical protein
MGKRNSRRSGEDDLQTSVSANPRDGDMSVQIKRLALAFI